MIECDLMAGYNGFRDGLIYGFVIGVLTMLYLVISIIIEIWIHSTNENGREGDQTKPQPLPQSTNTDR